MRGSERGGVGDIDFISRLRDKPMGGIDSEKGSSGVEGEVFGREARGFAVGDFFENSGKHGKAESEGFVIGELIPRREPEDEGDSEMDWLVRAVPFILGGMDGEGD